MYEYIKYGEDQQITLEKAKYVENDNLAVQMISHAEGYPEPWQNLTVTLSVKCEPDCAFIDTNNNGVDIMNWLAKNDIAYFTGKMKASGYCDYPEVRFTEKALSEMKEL